MKEVMTLQTASLLALASIALAQTSTLTVPFYGYDTQPIQASIISVANGATTMSLQCAGGTEADDCGLYPTQILTIGPGTYNMFAAVIAQQSTGVLATQDCSTEGTISAVCSETQTGDEALYPGVRITTYESTDLEVMPVTVTAGAALLGGSAASTASSVRTTSASDAKTGTETSADTASQTGSMTSSATPSQTSGAAISLSANVVAAIGGMILPWLM